MQAPNNTPTTSHALEVRLLFQQSTLQVLHLNQPTGLSIGDAPGCDFFAAGMPRTPLVTRTAQGPALCFVPGAALFVGHPRTPLLMTPNGTHLIEAGARYVLQLGSIELHLQRVSRAVPHLSRAATDRQIWAYTAGSTLLHALLLALLFQVSPEARSLDLTPIQSESQLVKFQTQPSEEKPEDVPTWLSEKLRGGLLGEQEGTMHKGPSGAMGKKHAKQSQGLYQIKDYDQELRLAELRAEEAMSQAGIVGLMERCADSSPLVSVFGSDTMDGTDPRDLLGGFLGDRPAEAEGGYGLGLRGTGIGGSYKGEGTLGAGTLGMQGAGAGGSCDDTCSGGFLGHGSGTGRGYDRIGVPRERTHTASTPEAIVGKAIVVGGLDKDVIRRVIKRAMPGIKYCYEQGLLQNKSLAGKVTIHFVIAMSGTVASAAPEAGISAEVDQCVARKISQLAFPKPNSTVEVTYPFVFQAAD